MNPPAWLEKLEGVVDKGPGQWAARCPCHDDVQPSLRVRAFADGSYSLHDFGGCRSDTILAKLGLSVADLRGATTAASPAREAAPPFVPSPIGHEVYQGLLDRLRLSDQHHRQLAYRGLQDLDIVRHGYKTVSAVTEARAIEALRQRWADHQLVEVLGFSKLPNGSLSFAAPVGSLLIPIRDADREIVALKARTGGEPKYKWCVARGQSVTPPPVHVVRGYPRNRSTVYVTEGPLKADICAGVYGDTWLGLPGIDSLRSLGTVGDLLEGKNYIVAIDNDWKVKPNVREGLKGLLATLAVRGKTTVLSWPLKIGKGLDDVIKNNGLGFVEYLSVANAVALKTEAVPADEAFDAAKAFHETVSQDRTPQICPTCGGPYPRCQ